VGQIGGFASEHEPTPLVTLPEPILNKLIVDDETL
jgi:hypothetical protein